MFSLTVPVFETSNFHHVRSREVSKISLTCHSCRSSNNFSWYCEYLEEPENHKKEKKKGVT